MTDRLDRKTVTVALVTTTILIAFLSVCFALLDRGTADRGAVYGGVDDESESAKTGRTYPAVDIAKIAGGHWPRPRAEVTGKAAEVRHEADLDWHIRLEDGKGNFIVAEINPEHSLPRPKVGDTVTVRGIVRHDGEHNWWEVHPVYWITVK